MTSYVANVKRHMDVLPNPATRVPLIALPNDPASSYINANFVRSYDGTPNRFICTQGPLPDTVVAFWRMVLEHGVDCIVMATGLEEKGEKKCEAYFPRTPSTPPLTFGGLAVACLAHTSGPAFDQALLEVSFAVRQRSGATSRRTHVVKHVWYHAWPDHGVPRTPDLVPDPSHILDMLQAVEAHRADCIARRDMEVCSSLLSFPLCVSSSPMNPCSHDCLPSPAPRRLSVVISPPLAPHFCCSPHRLQPGVHRRRRPEDRWWCTAVRAWADRDPS